jgi:hypothetical protein
VKGGYLKGALTNAPTTEYVPGVRMIDLDQLKQEEPA